MIRRRHPLASLMMICLVLAFASSALPGCGDPEEESVQVTAGKGVPTGPTGGEPGGPSAANPKEKNAPKVIGPGGKIP